MCVSEGTIQHHRFGFVHSLFYFLLRRQGLWPHGHLMRGGPSIPFQWYCFIKQDEASHIKRVTTISIGNIVVGRVLFVMLVVVVVVVEYIGQGTMPNIRRCTYITIVLRKQE